MILDHLNVCLTNVPDSLVTLNDHKRSQGNSVRPLAKTYSFYVTDTVPYPKLKVHTVSQE